MRHPAVEEILTMGVEKIVAKLMSYRKPSPGMMLPGHVPRVVLGVEEEGESLFLREILQLAIEDVLEVGAGGPKRFSLQFHHPQGVDGRGVSLPSHQIIGDPSRE